MLKLAKSQAKTKQNPEAEILLSEIYFFSSFMIQSKTNMRCSKKCAKNKWVYFIEIIWLSIKTRPHRYDIKRIRPSHGCEYTKCNMS